MSRDRTRTVSEMEAMSPDQRAQVVAEGFRRSLDDLDPALRARVEAKSRQIVDDHRLLDTDRS